LWIPGGTRDFHKSGTGTQNLNINIYYSPGNAFLIAQNVAYKSKSLNLRKELWFMTYADTKWVTNFRIEGRNNDIAAAVLKYLFCFEKKKGGKEFRWRIKCCINKVAA
jgi:hypothetical protein